MKRPVCTYAGCSSSRRRPGARRKTRSRHTSLARRTRFQGRLRVREGEPAVPVSAGGDERLGSWQPPHGKRLGQLPPGRVPLPAPHRLGPRSRDERPPARGWAARVGRAIRTRSRRADVGAGLRAWTPPRSGRARVCGAPDDREYAGTRPRRQPELELVRRHDGEAEPHERAVVAARRVQTAGERGPPAPRGTCWNATAFVNARASLTFITLRASKSSATSVGVRPSAACFSGAAGGGYD